MTDSQTPIPVAPASGPAPAGPVVVQAVTWWSDPVTLCLLLMVAEQLQDTLSGPDPISPRAVVKTLLGVLATFLRNRRNTVVQ